MTKRELRREIERLQFSLDLCGSRVQHLEGAIARLLQAEDASEMSNVAIALAHLRRLLERR